MVKNTIKVYARLKREASKLDDAFYKVTPYKDHEDLIIYSRQDNIVKSTTHTFRKYRFHKIFNQNSKQTEVFDDIAKPVVNSVLHGFNGTIFAYGQTGSGKTYSITGSPNKYKHRGLIPRTIEEIFEFTTTSAEKYIIYISYLEIYNEMGYDLLNPKQKASSLEELPRVYLLEDLKGEAHLKNLSLIPVSSEQEAMRLLFLGDTNRTIAETPNNEYSSRSHCIFTVHLTTKNASSGKVRRSKLHLVDLAGSERVQKSNITGTVLAEAKSINLSLLYLEQVIMALSESNRPHVPFRNSMMTFVLKDSLIGNSLTVMLATLSPKLSNIEETISTCKFAQRVSLVNIQAHINEELDPQQEISFLRNEVIELRKQLFEKHHVPKKDEKLSSTQKQYCQELVKSYQTGMAKNLNAETDIRILKYCISLMKQGTENPENIEINGEEIVFDEVVHKYKEIIKQKDEEISILNSLLENTVEPDQSKLFLNKTTSILKPIKTEKQLFDEFMLDMKNHSKIDFYVRTLQEKYHNAKDITKIIHDVQSKIMSIRLEMEKSESEQLDRLTFELKSQQNIYRESLLRLQNLKNETEFLKHGLNKAKIKVMQDFREFGRVNFNISAARLKLSGFDDLYGKSESITSSSSIENTFEGFQSEYNKYIQFDDNAGEEVLFPCPSFSSSNSNLYSSKNAQIASNIIVNNLKEECPKSINISEGTSIGKFDINKQLDKLLNEKSGCSHVLTSTSNSDTLPLIKTFAPTKFMDTSNAMTRIQQLKVNLPNIFEKHNFQKNPFHGHLDTKLCSTTKCGENSVHNLATKKISSCIPENNGTIPPTNKCCETSVHNLATKKIPSCIAESNESTLSTNKCCENSVHNLATKKIPSYVSIPPTDTKPAVISESTSTQNNCFAKDDGDDFKAFIKTVPLTGDSEVDDEIIKFYRMKFK